jgi:hypothetical protein
MTLTTWSSLLSKFSHKIYRDFLQFLDLGRLCIFQPGPILSIYSISRAVFRISNPHGSMRMRIYTVGNGVIQEEFLKIIDLGIGIASIIDYERKTIK